MCETRQKSLGDCCISSSIEIQEETCSFVTLILIVLGELSMPFMVGSSALDRSVLTSFRKRLMTSDFLTQDVELNLIQSVKHSKEYKECKTLSRIPFRATLLPAKPMHVSEDRFTQIYLDSTHVRLVESFE